VADSVPARCTGWITAAIWALISAWQILPCRDRERVAILAYVITRSERIIEDIRGDRDGNGACTVQETMLRLNRKQRTAMSETLRQVGNLTL
jgi:hypothetical protein